MSSYVVSPSMSDDERDIDIESDVSKLPCIVRGNYFNETGYIFFFFFFLQEDEGQGYSRGSGQYSQQVPCYFYLFKSSIFAKPEFVKL